MIVKAILHQRWTLDVVFGFPGPFVERMASSDCATHVIPHRNWLRTPGLMRFAQNLLRENSAARNIEVFLRESRPQLVYVNSLVSFAAVRAANRLGIPVIWHIRELFSDEEGELYWPTKWSKSLIRRTVRKMATTIVVNSSTVCRNVLGSQAGIVTVIPNAVPDNFFNLQESKNEARQSLGLPLDGHIVGFPGTLRPVKGHQTFLDATSVINAEQHDCHFVVTGAVQSEFARGVVASAESSPVSEKIHFIGAVDDMSRFYRACDVCCIASQSESFGRTAVEAFASQTPLVSTTVGGLADIIKDEKNALAIQPGDSAALAHQVIQILNDKRLAVNLTESAYAEARQKYTEQQCSDAVIKLIRSTAGFTRTLVAG